MAKKSRTQNTVLNSTAGMAAKILNIITGFIMRSIFISTLGVEYSGISSLFTDLLTLLSFAELGISSAIAYSLYKPIAEGDNRKISMLMQFYKRAYQVVAGAVLAMGLIMVPFMDLLVPADKINEAIRDDVSKYIILIFMLYVLNSSVSYLQIYKSTLLTAHQQHRKISSIQMVMSVVRVIVEAGILLTLNLVVSEENKVWIFITYLVAGIIITRMTNVIISVYTDKRYPNVDYKIKEKLPKEERQKLFKDVGALMIYKVCQEINTSLDNIVMSAFYGPYWVGLVANYRLVTGKVRLVIIQFFNSATPSMGSLAAEKDSEYQYKTFRALQFMAFWICSFCSTSFFVLLNPFIRLWLGEEFVMSMWLPLMFTAIFYSHTIIAPVSTMRKANGLFVQGKYRPLALCIINVILSVILAYFMGQGGKDPVAGIIGIKVATLISHFSTTHWYDPMIVYKNVFKKPLMSYFRLFFLYTAIIAGCTALTYGLGWCLFGTGTDAGFDGIIPGMPLVAAFIIKCVLCVIIPNVIVWLMFRRTDEYRYFVEILKKYAEKLKKKAAKKAQPALAEAANGTKEDNAQ